jgi:hypothetical protein
MAQRKAKIRRALRPTQSKLLATVDRKAKSGDRQWAKQLTDQECAAARDWINSLF